MDAIFTLFTALHIRLFRWSGGKIGGSMRGMPIVLLTTTGRKSGLARTVPLMYLEEDGTRFLIASKGGAPEHPAWFNNLSRNPEVTLELPGRSVKARAEVVTGPQREKLWSKLIARAPFYDEYRKQTTREIPVVALRELSP
jgi:deazaflavin-dependent oxidoreductase (nitroreductase family)